MASTLPDREPRRQAVLPDIRRSVMAKADVRAPDMDWLQAIGRAIQEAVNENQWSNKEAAAKVGVDDAEFGKWLSGGRRPQFDRLFNVPELRCPLVLALAVLVDGVELETTIRIRRRTR